jgi:predicted dehydrogenase
VIGANSFIARAAIYPAVQASQHIDIVAVASNSGAPPSVSEVRRSSYQDVLDDPQVEAVYIPLPNHMHREWTERAAAAGKHVLCEKPLATAPDDVAAMYAACRNAEVVLAEAFMTPFHPRTRAVSEAVSDGAIGDLRSIRSEFTFTIGPEHSNNFRWQPQHGGGALWDVGIYTLTPIIEHLDSPEVATVTSVFSGSGVDATTAVTLATSGATATAMCSFEMPERQLLEIRGTAGTISVPRAYTPSVDDDHYNIEHVDGSHDRIVTGGADPYRLMLEAFAGACRGGAGWPRGQGPTLAMVETIVEILSMNADGVAPARPRG